jgi:hypothetical protein
MISQANPRQDKHAIGRRPGTSLVPCEKTMLRTWIWSWGASCWARLQAFRISHAQPRQGIFCAVAPPPSRGKWKLNTEVCRDKSLDECRVWKRGGFQRGHCCGPQPLTHDVRLVSPAKTFCTPPHLSPNETSIASGLYCFLNNVDVCLTYSINCLAAISPSHPASHANSSEDWLSTTLQIMSPFFLPFSMHPTQSQVRDSGRTALIARSGPLWSIIDLVPPCK